VAEADLDLVRRGFAALDAGGVEALIPLIDADFEFTTPAGLAAEPDTYRGADGLRRYFDSFYEAMEEVRFEPRRFEDLGEGKVMAPCTLKARGRSTGIETAQEVVIVWKVRDAKVAHLWVYADVEAARAAQADS
jgi:ketosteroid isomerase-like protein